MNNRTTGIIITIVAVVLCGCPGLVGLCLGLVSLIDVAFNQGNITGFSDFQSGLPYTVGGICGGIVFIAIAAAVAFFMLRKKKEDTTISNEPLPPAY
jgi:hypothetical protein